MLRSLMASGWSFVVAVGEQSSSNWTKGVLFVRRSRKRDERVSGGIALRRWGIEVSLTLLSVARSKPIAVP
jgi:hypothetical protein